ncbi:unnamed protein product [Allacma fusca]|uniref:Gustatory receptor n=1 Tax=Allacma fusca TaxID=39272 RepID=A0A8J2JK98_9HEXA|nr:unnamed protein product [Allacma fusca]
MQPKEKIFYHYRIFFNIIYYLGLSPYRVTSVCNSKPYILIYTSFQKIFCAVFHVTLCLASLTILWGRLIDTTTELPLNQNPMRVFYIARAIGFPAYAFTFFFCIWFRKEKFFYLLHLVLNPQSTCNWQAFKIAIVTTVVSMVALCIAPFHMIGEDYFYNCTEWDFHKSFPIYGGFVAHNLFLQPTSETLSKADLTLPMTCIILVYGIINIYLIIVIHLADCFALVGALALRKMAKEFSLQLTTTKAIDSEKLIRTYAEIKGIVDSVNYSTGPIVVCMFFVTLPYFVENFITLFDPVGDWPLKVRFLYYCTHFFAIMIIAADANHILTETKSFLFRVIFHVENRVPKVEFHDHPIGSLKDTAVEALNSKQNQNDFNSWKLVILYLETSAANLGLRGCGFFTITYGFLGSIVGILVTYFIVVVQFKSTHVPVMPTETRPSWIDCGDDIF